MNNCSYLLFLLVLGNLHLKNPDCEGFVDVGFILDSSGSLQYHYREETKFLKTLANSFGISSRGSHAGVVAFSDVASLSIQLDEFLTDITFNEAVDKIEYMGRTTRIDLGLQKALELFDESKGARKDVPKLLFLLTDGQQTGNENPVPIANQLRQKGIQLFAIGIGFGVKKTELDKIADNPQNVFLVENFQKLLQGNFLKRVKQGSCNSGIVVFLNLIVNYILLIIRYYFLQICKILFSTNIIMIIFSTNKLVLIFNYC